jgi:acyl-CoA thioesterase-1
VKQLTIVIFLLSSSLVWANSEKETKDQVKTILVLGDSVSEGYGVAKKDSYPSLLEKKLKEKHNVKVINSSISGSTSASAPGRLKWALRNKPDILILALGGNDGLRGIQPEATFNNLDKTIQLAKKNNIKILLAGMVMPFNYGKEYRKEFSGTFSKLAKKHKLEFMPFLLKDVGGNKDLNLPDGIHPNEKGYKIVVKNILPHVEKLL